MTPSTNLVAKVILLLLAISVLGHETMRAKRRGRNAPELIAIVAVSVGLILLLAYQFTSLGDSSERAVSISGLLILGGVAVDLIATVYHKFSANEDRSSIER